MVYFLTILFKGFLCPFLLLLYFAFFPHYLTMDIISYLLEVYLEAACQAISYNIPCSTLFDILATLSRKLIQATIIKCQKETQH